MAKVTHQQMSPCHIKLG